MLCEDSFSVSHDTFVNISIRYMPALDYSVWSSFFVVRIAGLICSKAGKVYYLCSY